MLFLALIIYVAVWIPLKFLVRSAAFLMDMKPVALHAVMYAVALAISFVFAFLVHSYQPEFLPGLKKISKAQGVRWISLLTAISAGIFFFIALSGKSEMICLFFPVAVVSALNWLGIEIRPAWLSSEEESPKTDSPRMPMPLVKQDIQRIFKWMHDGEEYQVAVNIRNLLLERIRSEKHPDSIQSWANDLKTKGNKGEILDLGQRLAKIGKIFGTVGEVNLVLDFIQSGIKVLEEESAQIFDPVETLVEKAGNRCSMAIFSAALFKSMGYNVALIQSPGHFAIGVNPIDDPRRSVVELGNMRYYYCERTPTGWITGEPPKDFKEKATRIYPV